MEKRLKILNCAKDLFLAQGYKSTSIQAIADKAEISKGAVYLYFKSKDEILLSIFRQIEEQVWSKIAVINDDESLSPEAKYRRQILTFYQDIMENLQFNQMMLNESGVALNEAFYNYAREYRYRLQQAQELAVHRIYGDALTPWLSELVIAINGIVQELDASIVLDNLELELEKLTDFVCNLTRYLAQGFLTDQPEMLLNEEHKKIREDFLVKLADQKFKAIDDAFQVLITAAEKITDKLPTGESDANLMETLALLKDAMQQSSLNKTLVKALLENLHSYRELQLARENLAALLAIKLR